MLDIKTALFLWAMEASTLAVLLAGVWLHDRTQRHYGWWSVGFAAHGLGVALVSLRGEIPDWLSIPVANGIALSCFIFWIGGMLSLGRKPFAGWSAVPMLLWIAGMLLPAIRDDIAYRIALYNGASAFGFLMLGAVALLYDNAGRMLRRLLAGVWAGEALVSLTVAGISLKSMPRTLQDAPFSAISTITSIFGLVAVIMIGARIVMDRSEARLRHLVRTDPLTGALNRRGLAEDFAALSPSGGGEKRLVALALFDLDHFKSINDTYGHQAGDAVILAFTRLAQKLMPERAIFGRTGGEEFMAAIEIGDVREAALLTEAIRQALAATRVATDRGEIAVTVSIGIATAPAAEAELEDRKSTRLNSSHT